MAEPQYWLGHANREGWDAYLSQDYDLGGQRPFGFPVRRRRNVKKMRVGDIIITYMTGDKTFIAAWEIVDEHYINSAHILAGVAYSECVNVKEIVLVDPRQGAPAHDLRKDLEICRRLANPDRDWGLCVRTSAQKWPRRDGELIVERLREISDRLNGRDFGAPIS